MRTKKTFLFDEEKDAARVISEGFPNGMIDYSKMYLLAKYFRAYFGYGAIRLERELIRFCKSQDKNFNPVTEADAIQKWIKSAMNYKLRKVTSISISENEIAFLNTISVPKDRKILFMTLVLAKALKRGGISTKSDAPAPSEHFYIKYGNFADVIRLARIHNMREIDLAEIYHKYPECFLFYSAEKELVRVEYIDHHPERIETEITDLANVFEFYELLFGKGKISEPRISKCEKCGNEFERKGNNQKFCKSCSIENRKTKQKELMRERREK